MPPVCARLTSSKRASPTSTSKGSSATTTSGRADRRERTSMRGYATRVDSGSADLVWTGGSVDVDEPDSQRLTVSRTLRHTCRPDGPDPAGDGRWTRTVWSSTTVPGSGCAESQEL
jgi:hypothetical protein